MDLNIRYPGHPLWKENEFQIQGELEQLIQRIELWLWTVEGEQIGWEEGGSDVRFLIWDLNVPEKKITRTVQAQLRSEIFNPNGWRIETEFEKSGTVGILRINLFEPGGEGPPVTLETIIK